METASSYFTRRARQERTNAIDAVSAEARSAHLELAVRLVRRATQSALWRGWSSSLTIESTMARRPITQGMRNVGYALAGAYPTPAIGTFEDLLKAVDETRGGKSL
jgi:hypothetical protein